MDGTGRCALNDTDVCQCFTGYDGAFCERVSTATEPTLQSTNNNSTWIIIIAVVSAAAGLLLIISLVLCVCYMINRARTKANVDSGEKPKPAFIIPRVPAPIFATQSPNLIDDNRFSLDDTQDMMNPRPDSPSAVSRTTTYNATYRTNGTRAPANFDIFDNLENNTRMAKGSIPQGQMRTMLGTLNSFPAADEFNDPSILNTSGADGRELSEIELVTDILDDMMQEDGAEDDFLEVLNPNVMMPRPNFDDEHRSASGFSVKKIFSTVQQDYFSYCSFCFSPSKNHGKHFIKNLI